MHALSVENAIKDLPGLIDKTIKDVDEVVIVSDAGAVVMVDQKEFESMKETLRLLKDKQSLKALFESHKARDENKPVDAKSIDEAFYDLQG